jgi:hypothetical protein
MLMCVLSGLVHLDLRGGHSRRGRSPRPVGAGKAKASTFVYHGNVHGHAPVSAARQGKHGGGRTTRRAKKKAARGAYGLRLVRRAIRAPSWSARDQKMSNDSSDGAASSVP